MFDSKCSFAITLIKEDFACEQAQIVTRRAGPDIACASDSASRRCMDVADVLGCSKSALENNYLDVINEGRANLNTSILRKQYEVGITDKNVTMLKSLDSPFLH